MDKKLVNMFMHSASGYSYPFSFEEVVECGEGELVIEAQGSQNQWQISNTFVVVCPLPNFT